MKAALLTELNSPLVIADVEPGETAFGQVLVRVISAGICGAQLQEIRGEKGGPLPHLMGHEGCGIVEEIGAGVSRVKPGDKVVMHWRKAAGLESAFPRYRRNGPIEEAGHGPVRLVQEFTSGLVTTWAEQTICSENRLTPVPVDTDPDLCTLLGCSLSTAMATVESEATRWGERVLVIGCGGLGLSLLATLPLSYPARLCACDVHDAKRRPAEIAGAEFVNTTSEKIDGRFDLILDTAGAPLAMEAALPHLAPSGRYVMIGQPAPGKPVCIDGARHMFEGEGKSIRATQGGGFRPDVDIPRFLSVAKELFIGNLITHRVPLAQINHALDLVRQGEAGRVLVEINSK